MKAIVFRLALGIAVMIQGLAFGQSGEMADITGGEYLPLYGTGDKVLIEDFEMDIKPVTNAEYLAFVKKNPGWKRSNVKKLFADANYLRDWVSDEDFGNLDPNAPVTWISWYAAKNFCQCQEKRLPTVDEWEYVAMANQTQRDARKDDAFNKYILEGIQKHNGSNQAVGQTMKNVWGVFDLHGLVWEWTLDFNSVMASGESRKGGRGDVNLFCGAAAVGATDLLNYPAFTRYAFRNSVKANYTVKNLGFRCVKDAKTAANLSL